MATTPINNDQPSLAIHELVELVELVGVFPPRDGGAVDPGGTYLAFIRGFAGNFPWGGTAFADGQILAIAQNQALFSLLALLSAVMGA